MLYTCTSQLNTQPKSICNTTVTLPKPTVGRQLASKILENRVKSAYCRPTSAPILVEFLVGRRLFCRSTQVKSFDDRSADFHGICHRWSVGRWSPDDRSTFWRNLYHDIGRRSPDNRVSIGRRSPDGRLKSFYYKSRWSPDCRPIIKCGLYYIFNNVCIHMLYEIKSNINAILGFISLDLVYKYHLVFCCFLDFLLYYSYGVLKLRKYFT